MNTRVCRSMPTRALKWSRHVSVQVNSRASPQRCVDHWSVFDIRIVRMSMLVARCLVNSREGLMELDNCTRGLHRE